jgi:N-methylhydantoinase B/oxoprolinase/acetone carboxylase alpha subunit
MLTRKAYEIPAMLCCCEQCLLDPEMPGPLAALWFRRPYGCTHTAHRHRAAAAAAVGVSQTFVEVVYISVQVLAYTLMTFFMMQLQPTAGMFFYVLLLIWMSCMVQVSDGPHEI